MRVREVYSHLNGKEHILVHNTKLWEEIEKVIASIDAEACRTKVSKEKTKAGKVLYSPVSLNRRYADAFEKARLARIANDVLGHFESRGDPEDLVASARGAAQGDPQGRPYPDHVLQPD